MNKNTIKIMANNQAQVSKTFAKNARIYGTDEYKLWREFKAENPEFVMVVKTIKKNPDKRTTKNLTYKNMRDFIKEQNNASELLYEFEREIRMSKIQTSPYRAVLAWFLNKFENYDSYKDFFKNADEQNTSETRMDNIKNLPSVVNE